MAKPDNWDSLDVARQIDIARNMLNTTRGHLIMGQALGYALRLMSEREHPELSNMEDMEMLGLLFDPWFTNYSDTDAMARARAKYQGDQEG